MSKHNDHDNFSKFNEIMSVKISNFCSKVNFRIVKYILNNEDMEKTDGHNDRRLVYENSFENDQSHKGNYLRVINLVLDTLCRD